MNIRMLGPFAVEVDGTPLKLAGPKQRAVLSLLAVHANVTVPVERLIDGLWGEEPPPTAAKMVQQYVSQLRRMLIDADGPEILTRGSGYELQIEPSAVDALQFEQLVEQAARDGDGTRGGLARAALDLWRGPPLADLLDEPFAAPEARRLEELRLRAIELTVEGDLDAGRDAEAIGALRSLVEEHPLRERLRGLLMLALYRAGRQAEALDVFQDVRWTLVEELGLEPGPELRRLQEAILRQDPALERVVPDAAWASRETAQQVGAGAGRISRVRGELRADERELAANVIDLQTLRERAARRAPAPGGAVCPFKGLESFEVGDAQYYFGRERLVAEIVARLPGTSLLGVIGASGSGKSSAVRAGLVPSLSSGVLPGSQGWTRALMRPGEQPMAALRRALRSPSSAENPVAAALDSLGGAARLMLVVDQFEETFTACRDEAQRAAFLNTLVAPAARGDSRYLAVLALRADYYGACAGHPQLARLLGENHVLVGPMHPEELERAIEGPAARVGLAVEPELVTRLVEETAGRPGGLPLLSTTLLELWQSRSGNRMTLAAYEQTGGVEGAVARLAETAYQSLSREEAATARNILLRLAGETGLEAAAVRRQVPLSELDLARSHSARRVLDVLTESRLLTVGGDTVEVAHEALLREWPRLRQWLEEDSDARRLHGHITVAAREWHAGERDPGELYRGARLAAALDFAAAHGDALNALEREYLDEARLVSEREAVRSRRMNRRLRALLAAAVVTLAAAGMAGIVALDQRGEARDAATVADAQRLGAQALTDDSPDHALLLGLAGVAIDDSPATRGSLLTTLFRQPPALLGVFRGKGDEEIYGLAVSPAGDRVAFGDRGGDVRLFALPSRRLLRTYRMGVEGIAAKLAFSPDGKTLAVGGHTDYRGTEPPGGLVDLLDASTLRRRKRVVMPPPPVEAWIANTPAFVANGRDLVVLQTPFGGPQPHRVWRIDGDAGELVGGPISLPSGAALPLMTAGDRAYVTHGDEDATWEIDTAAWRIVRRHAAGGAWGALQAESGTIALGRPDGVVQLLNVRTGRVRRLAGRHPKFSSVAITRDGRTVVTSAEDGSLRVWDAQAGRTREELEGPPEAAEGLAITPDGNALISAGYDDGRAFMWELPNERRLVRRIPLGAPFEVEDPTPRGMAVSPDGQTLAVGGVDGTVDLIDTSSLQRRARLRAGQDPILGIDFARGGRMLSTSDSKGRVRLWDAATLTPAAELEGLRGWAQAIAISPDGKLLAASVYNWDSPHLRVWDVERRAPIVDRELAASSLTFSPDGELIAVADGERGAHIVDARTGKLVKKLELDALPRSVAFSPDGRLVFVGTRLGTGQFFTTADWRPIGISIQGRSERLTSAQFTADGRTLATASSDGTVTLWDVATRKPIGSRMTVEPGSILAAVVSRDGRALYAVSAGREGIRLDLSPGAWTRHACRIAGRELTRREWREAAPRQPYRTLCR